jgi:Trk K+ transport system NAD-binding subunit
VLPQLSLIVGNPRARLRDVNLPRARSLIVLTDDEVANLEIALEAKMIHPQCRLVLRMDDPAFSGSVSQLVPGAQAFGTYAVAAEAFTAAALGETVHGLLHLDGETVLVIEYAVAAGDTLAGRRLAEIAYGYGLVPISHQRAGREQTELLPSEDLDVLAGDRLIALATSEGVRRVEQGRLRPRAWRVRVDSAWTRESLFDATMAIARVSGCEIATARALMSQLPGTLDVAMYRHQAVRLVRELHAAGCRASLLVEAQEPRQTANFTPPETVSPA